MSQDDSFFEETSQIVKDKEDESSQVVVSVSENIEAVLPNSEEASESSLLMPAKEQADSLNKSEKSGNRLTQSSIKVDTERVDGLLDLVGELVVIKSQLMQKSVVRQSSDTHLSSILAQMDKMVRELYDRTLSIRMTSMRPLFIKVQRIVQDLSKKLNKPVKLRVSGEMTEIDRLMIDQLSDPIVHLARNAIDHGLESVEERKACGKSEKGHMSCEAYQEGSSVILEFTDDGKGISHERVFKKARGQGLIPSSAVVDDYSIDEINQLIFKAGFSTAEVVSDVSGRGVGLDVVKSNIEKLQGAIHVISRQGEGTTFRLILPLTSAIADGMMVVINGNRYILAIPEIHELIKLHDVKISTANDGEEIVNIREEFLSLLRAGELLDIPCIHKEDHNSVSQVVMVVGRGTNRYALLVDAVLGQSQFVIKGLGEHFQKVPGVSGGAIMGDGRVALILDVESLAQKYRLELKSGNSCPWAREQKVV